MNKDCIGLPTIEKKKQSISSEILDLASSIRTFTDDTLNEATEKLNSISYPSKPQECEAEKDLSKEYPPLYEELRLILRGIDSRIKSIRDLIRRTET